MNMTISAANYLGSTQQNSQISFSEKHELKDSSTEAGKTEQAENAGVYQYVAEGLSKYTDTELKQMYRKGEITLQEYRDETGETVD